MSDKKYCVVMTLSLPQPDATDIAICTVPSNWILNRNLLLYPPVSNDAPICVPSTSTAVSNDAPICVLRSESTQSPPPSQVIQLQPVVESRVLNGESIVTVDWDKFQLSDMPNMQCIDNADIIDMLGRQETLINSTKLAVDSMTAKIEEVIDAALSKAIDEKLEAFSKIMIQKIEGLLNVNSGDVMQFIGTTNAGLLNSIKESIDQQPPISQPNVSFVHYKPAPTEPIVADAVDDDDAVAINPNLNPNDPIDSLEKLKLLNDEIVNPLVAAAYVSYKWYT